jgi:hypothetical protein
VSTTSNTTDLNPIDFAASFDASWFSDKQRVIVECALARYFGYRLNDDETAFLKLQWALTTLADLGDVPFAHEVLGTLYAVAATSEFSGPTDFEEAEKWRNRLFPNGQLDDGELTLNRARAGLTTGKLPPADVIRDLDVLCKARKKRLRYSALRWAAQARRRACVVDGSEWYAAALQSETADRHSDRGPLLRTVSHLAEIDAFLATGRRVKADVIAAALIIGDPLAEACSRRGRGSLAERLARKYPF